MNDVQIVFFGRLLDQFGSPVAGAQIAADVRIYNGKLSTIEHLKTISDGNGLFQINGGKGESLGIMPQKTGYVLASRGTYFKYSYMYSDRFSPDPNNPTVINMWKLQGAEPLVSINLEYKLHYTSTPINFDLLTGKIVATGGDVGFVVTRPTGAISERNPQDWGIEIYAVDGGLIETSGTDEAFTFAAPERGYQSKKTLMASSNRHGIGVIQEAFFLRSRNGQVFSKLALSVSINELPDEAITITVSGVANANGSRNWEATIPTGGKQSGTDASASRQ